MMTDLQYNQKHALVNGIVRHGRAVAFTRQELAQKMRRARKRIPAHLAMNLDGLPLYMARQRTFMMSLSAKYNLR